MLKQFLKDIRGGCQEGGIEISTLRQRYSLKTLPKGEDMYFVGNTCKKSGRSSDADIVSKTYFALDFDLRSNHKQATGETMTDEDLEGYLPKIKEFVAGLGLEDWRYIVFSGNGYHFYYISDKPEKIDKKTYTLGMTGLLEYLNTEVVDKVMKLDDAVKNIGRLLRLPGTPNTKREKEWGLPVRDCEIVEFEDRWSGMDVLELLAERQVKMQAVQVDYNKTSKPKYDGDDAIQAILSLPMEEIFANDCGLQIKKTGDKYNFVRPGEKDYIGAFVHNNTLFDMGTKCLQRANDKGFDPFQYVKKKNNLSNAETYQWFRDRYTIPEQKKPEPKPVKPVMQSDHYLSFSNRGMTLGTARLDEEFSQPNKNGELMVLYGNSGMGKTEYAYYMALKNKEKGIKTLYLSLETPPSAMVQRKALARCRIKRNDTNKIDPVKEQRANDEIKNIEKEMGDDVVLLGYKEMPTVDNIIDICEDYYKKGFRLFVIDNLGKINTEGEKEIEAQGRITSKLQTWATQEKKTHILLVHHGNKGTRSKEVDGDDIKRLGANGIRGSQKIIDNCQRLIEIYVMNREEGYTDIMQYKQTHTGYGGRVYLQFDKGEYSDF